MNFYIHIPFCRQKCPYCKFALTPIFDEVKKKRYLGYLKKEIGEYFFMSSLGSEDLLERGRDSPSENDKEIQTIYFGGGTPSILSLCEVSEILDLFPRNENTEISFECNPEDISHEYISGLFNLGVNRLSIGVQSLNNETLRAIHRSDRESIFKALENIEFSLMSFSERESLSDQKFTQKESSLHKDITKSFGILHFESCISVNIDLILGLPYSKPGETLENIRELHEKFPFITHTSVYMLEEGHYPKDWKEYSISIREMENEYSSICEYFESIGWHHYEISNWGKPGYESRHNRGYWNHTNTRGFGLSATSYQEGKRGTNSSSFSGYYRGDIEQSEILTKSEMELERVIYNLRTFSLKSDLYKGEVLEKLIIQKYAKIESGKILLTPAGIFRENTIIAELEDNRAISPP